MASVGFIGLGNMGGKMALNLHKQYADMKVFDVSAANMKELEEKGAKVASGIADIAKSCDTIITMLPATQHVSSVLREVDGIFANAKRGTLIIDCSTIDPVESRKLNNEATALGLHMIDAPVSGGVTGAAAGTLTFMVGASQENYDRAQAYLNLMGKKAVLCGGPGAGGVTKLCNNLALAIQMIGTSEALALGVRLGMDPKVLSEVMNTSTARCWSSDSYNPCPGVMENVPASRNYTGGFAVGLMEKDLGLAMGAAAAVKARLPLGSNALQLYGLMSEHGNGDRDFSSVYEFLSKALPKK